jgi:hypothetical protein
LRRGRVPQMERVLGAAELGPDDARIALFIHLSGEVIRVAVVHTDEKIEGRLRGIGRITEAHDGNPEAIVVLTAGRLRRRRRCRCTALFHWRKIDLIVSQMKADSRFW